MTSILRIEAAGTRICCTDQHKLRRKFIRSAVSCNDNSLILQRLAKKVQALPSEFRELIQKQYSPVGKRYGSGSRKISSSDQCLLRNGVMGCHKGPLSDERSTFRKLSRNAVNGGYFQTFFVCQLRQNSGKASCHHRFAGARRSDHQNVMKSRCCNLQGPLYSVLSADIRQIHSFLLLFGFMREHFLRLRRKK